ncbi:MAG: ABC transporter ATP-binding protein [Defluviitaleaceae bacterium]|nr:ABC transporter ATP-binding protein [Defluviitaleaceae bacterium]MCL2273300.1 ABC transporter ATP-binding protein [Defluviitaleaceae bacterium]
MNTTLAVKLHNVTKTFDRVIAVEGVDFTLQRGEVLALMGENGSGKTTLMNMLAGIYHPDGGEMEINGVPSHITSPKDAFDLGIGMVHQHFKLVDVLTATENILLGLSGAHFLDRKKAAREVAEISERYGFSLDPNKKIYNMSVSEKQTVEIVKVLYRGASILILDEPTAVLTPQESDRLFETLRKMRNDNKAIIIITHKLHEVLAVSDRVHVLRKGKTAGTVHTCDADRNVLTEMMVGKAVKLSIDRPVYENKEKRLVAENLSVTTPEGITLLRNAAFTLQSGEILGVAGVAGSGQKELCEALAGLCPAQEGGTVTFYPSAEGEAISILGKSPQEINTLGISLAFVPEDRLGMGLVAGMDMTDNVLLRHYKRNRGPFADRAYSRNLAQRLVDRLKIATPSVSTTVRRLSGGNVQKVLLGREIASVPRVLIVAYPARGLDVHSAHTIYDLLNEQKKKGVAILFIGEDLDVLLEIADRIMVLCGGEITGTVNAADTTKEEVGLLMAQQHTSARPTEEIA